MFKKFICITLLVFTSLTTSANNKYELKTTDTTKVEDKNIHYKTYDDQNFIYVSISTADNKLAMSMIKNGLTVYFDTKGKKKENVYIKYPIKNNSKIGQQRNNTDSNERLYINSIVQNISEEAEYEYYNEKRQFNKYLNTLNISLGYQVKGDILEYYLKIPKEKVTKKNKTDLSKLTIGVITNKRESNNNEVMDSGNDMSRGGGMRSGGGRDGGGRRSGGMSRGGIDENSGRETIEKIEIDFWFDANLKKQ